MADTPAESAYLLTVKDSELEEHLAHGDTEGACPYDCMGVPFGQAALDFCGVCGGDNSTCKDCAGVPRGKSRLDACGVCNGDNKSCAGCDGVPLSGKVIDACGRCGGDNSSCLDCAGIPNGGARLDQCGVCNGDNSSCRDCTGTLNGAARIDACGQCVTVPEGVCALCAGRVDRCGVCNGHDECLDCAGIPNGGTLLDCCGICGGDGGSCLDKCRFYDLGRDKQKARQGARNLSASVLRYSRDEGRCDHRRKVAARKRIAAALRMQQASNALLSRYVATRMKICDTPFCKKSNLVSVLSAVRNNVKKLHVLSRQAQYAAKKACVATSRTLRRSVSGARSAKARALAALKNIPAEQCN